LKLTACANSVSNTGNGIVASILLRLSRGLTRESLGFTDATYLYNQYKNEVQEALENHFGKAAVKRGNKAFDVHETSYHVEADVAAFFEHRRYLSSTNYLEGVELRTDKDGKSIINWPEQHYQTGVKKNNDTGTRFKSVVRILKALSNDMSQKGIRDSNVPGFLIECLVWNVPNDSFQYSTYTADVRNTLAHIFNNTMDYQKCKDWREVSELIYLFHSYQKWTWQQAHAFTSAAWDYLETNREELKPQICPLHSTGILRPRVVLRCYGKGSRFAGFVSIHATHSKGRHCRRYSYRLLYTMGLAVEDFPKVACKNPGSTRHLARHASNHLGRPKHQFSASSNTRHTGY